MKLVSQDYKNGIKQLGKQLDCKISFNKGKELIELGSNELNLVKTCYKGDLLKSLMKELEVDSNVYIPTGSILKVKLGLLVNGVYEYIDFGEFVVKSSEKQENERSYLIKCYDKMLFSMKPYTNLGISYPISVNEYINTISLHLGMQFANYNTLFTNSDKLIPKELYLDDKGNSLGYTFRDVFNELSAVVGANIGVIDNKITIIDFNDTNVTIDEDSLKDTNVNFGKKFGPINSVVLNRNEDKIFNKDDTSITNNGLCEIEIKDNQILNGNDRDTYLQEIFNKINGLEFYLNDFESTGITYLEFGDKYNVKIGNQVYNCLMLDDEISIEQGLSEYVVTEEPSTTETDYKKSDKTDIKINRTLLEVDKQSGKITALVNENTKQNEKINTLEITSNETKSTITNIEKDLSSANAKIDGVSASFTDFKDNEYIQSIQGLQDQIDGAIQFWNGQEIPTLNNYPANEWISENDKINHIADIYTVIEDINGEMKQGKSYRFDKVQNVWQWIELTDNELSAVQKIAQDALNKANANEQEVGVLKQTTSELKQSDTELKASVTSIEKQMITEISTSGSNIQIDDGANAPFIDFSVDGKSYQETSETSPSPDFPSEIESVGYENLIKSPLELGNINADGTNDNSYLGNTRSKNYEAILPNKKYIVFSQAQCKIALRFYTQNKTFIKSGTTNNSPNIFISPNNAYYVRFVFVGITDINNNIQLEKGTTPHSYIPYGKYGLDITNVGKNLFDISKLSRIYTTENLGTINNGDGTITIKTSPGDSTGGESKETLQELCPNLKPNKEYVLSANSTGTNKYIYIRNTKSIWNFNTNKTLTQEDLNSHIYFYASGVNSQCVISNIQIELGTQPTPYEPYQSYNTQLLLPTQLKSIDNIQDKLVKQDGTWGILETSKSITFNGSENWKSYGKYESNYLFYLDGIFPKGNTLKNIIGNGYSNYFEWGETKKYYVRFQYRNGSRIYFAIINNLTIEQWKQWLKDKYNSGNPVIVQYELETPTFIPLDQENQDKLNALSTIKGTNNITTTDNLEPNINLTYVADTNITNYVENQLRTERTTREENISELKLNNESIVESVTTIQSDLNDQISTIQSVENKITSQDQTINIISKNIDKSTGEIREITTTNGFTFNNKGLNIYTDENSYNTLIDNQGTYYKDGDSIVSQTTRQGSIIKDLSEQGQHRYAYDSIKDDYAFIEEIVEVNGEKGYATFYNWED